MICSQNIHKSRQKISLIAILILLKAYYLSHVVDINECASNVTNNCHDNATCHNTNGGYNCTCNNGYEGNGTYCKGKGMIKQGLPENT